MLVYHYSHQEKGEATQSIISNLLNAMSRSGTISAEDEEVIKNVGAVIFEGKTPQYSGRDSVIHMDVPSGHRHGTHG